MDSPSRPRIFERLSSLLLRKPDDREQLLEILHAGYERNLMDADALTIIEGALAASDTRVTEPGSRYIDFLIPGLLGMNLMSGSLWGVGFVIVDMRVKPRARRLAAWTSCSST